MGYRLGCMGRRVMREAEHEEGPITHTVVCSLVMCSQMGDPRDPGCITTLSLDSQVKSEKMAESTGTAAAVRKPALSPSISISCDNSKASAGSVAPYHFGSGPSAGPAPQSGSGTPTGGQRASAGSRASKRLKSHSVPVGSLPAQGWAVAAPAAPAVQRASSQPPLGGPDVWGTSFGGQHPVLPAPAYAAPASSFGQWQVRACRTARVPRAL